MIATLRERAKTLGDLVELAHFYLSDEIRLDEKAAAKFLSPESREPLKSLATKLESPTQFTEEEIERALAEIL